MINIQFYFLHIQWVPFILTSTCVLIQTKYKTASLSINTCQHNLKINVTLVLIRSLLVIAKMYMRCNVMLEGEKNINDELCFWVIFYQIKNPEIFHVYLQKGISFIKLVSGKIMLKLWTFDFSYLKKNTMLCNTMESSFSWGTNVCGFRGIPLRTNLQSHKPIHIHVFNIYHKYPEYTTIEITSPWSRTILATHKHWPQRTKMIRQSLIIYNL